MNELVEKFAATVPPDPEGDPRQGFERLMRLLRLGPRERLVVLVQRAARGQPR